MKKSLFILCCISFLGTAFCQNSVVVSEQSIHGNTLNSVIKEYRYPSTITCIFSEDSSSTFIYADQTMQTREFTVPDLKVNDMVICINGGDGRNDTVFFCGQRTDTGLATFGFFNINDAFNGTGQVYLHIPFLSGDGVTNVMELTRMVPFSDGLNSHYACIGINERKFPCIVEEVVGPAPSIWYYRTGTLPYNMETMYDIKMVYNMMGFFIVTAGMNYELNGNKRYLSLRVYDLSDIFAPSGIQETKYIFCIDTSFGVEWNKDDVLIRHVKDGFFATVSYLNPKLYNNIVCGSRFITSLNSVHIGVFKLNNLLSGSVSGMASSTVFEPLDLSDDNLTWFVNGPEQTFVFQEKTKIPLSTESSSFSEVTIDGSMNVSSVRRFTTPGDIYCGLDSYNSNNHYVMSGYEEAHRSILKYGVERFGTSKTCFKTVPYEYVHYNPYRSVNMTKAFETTTRRSEFIGIEVETAEVPLTVECQN